MGGWGRQFLNISPAGKVLPCHAAESITTLTFDRVGDKSLREIWLHSPAFEAYRGTDWMPEPFRPYERRELDWGGCRCPTLALTRETGTAHPPCALSPAHGATQSHGPTEPPNARAG